MSEAYGSNGGTRVFPTAVLITVANDAALRFRSGLGNPGTVSWIALHKTRVELVEFKLVIF